MTLVELAKRTGEGIDTLKHILLNIGESISLEFQPIAMDVAELVAMELEVNVRRAQSTKVPVVVAINTNFQANTNILLACHTWWLKGHRDTPK
ncbi:hypothetical protein SUGI_0283220 [Cryptomeria japonica]|nr:hypothetical protein SUGI_0283220 [Cryptomeria japonica]